MRLVPELYHVGSMSTCGVLLILSALCAVAVITVVAFRSRAHRSAAPVSTPAVPAHAVARTHFVDGGGYVEVGGVVAWASADPAVQILPGHVLHYEPRGDGHTVTVFLADDSAWEEHRA